MISLWRGRDDIREKIRIFDIKTARSVKLGSCIFEVMVSVLQVWSLILALFVASGDSHCPETEQGLIKWSDHQAAWSGSVRF